MLQNIKIHYILVNAYCRLATDVWSMAAESANHEVRVMQIQDLPI